MFPVFTNFPHAHQPVYVVRAGKSFLDDCIMFRKYANSRWFKFFFRALQVPTWSRRRQELAYFR